MLGVGAVLSVEREGEEFPVAYFSKILTAAERNYSASEMECLAVVKAVDHFAIHLLGQRFTVVTDHRALVALQESSRLNGRLMRWALALQAYNFDIHYRPGKYHQNANGLSRQCWPEYEPSRKREGTGTTSTEEVTTLLLDDHHPRTDTASDGGVTSLRGGLSPWAGEMSRADPRHRP